jgi:hypothetical protein
MKRLVMLVTFAAVVAAVIAILRRRPAPPSASPTAPPTPVAPKSAPSVPAPTAAADPAWAEPTADGGCPEGYPVKLKRKSGIFHVPDGVLYERTVPDRCYATPEAAEADGHRQSLR